MSGSSSRSKKVKKENVVLASKGSNQGQGEKRNKKDLLKVKCFRYGEFGHYNTQCPLTKDMEEKRDQQETLTEIEGCPPSRRKT